MTTKIGFIRSLGCAAILAGAASASTCASLIEVIGDGANSTDQLGQVRGFIEYAPSTTKLTITLTNMSDPADGGYITAFLFNINSQDPAARATLTSSTHQFQNIRGMAPPFGGPFPAGAGVGRNWLGGGLPQHGIAAGDTGVFVFDVNASDAAMLSATSFISGDHPFNFVVRFRGFSDGRSDKVPVVLIPAPATVGLLFVAALCGVRRRRTG